MVAMFFFLILIFLFNYTVLSDNDFSDHGVLEVSWLEKEKEAMKKYQQCQMITNSSECACYLPEIATDLEPFRKGITTNQIQSASSKGVTYLIYDGKLYRSRLCSFPARCQGVEHFLLKIVKDLPNLKFILNPRDWPQITKNFGEILPVFSFSKTKDYSDIQYPAWSFWAGGPAISLYPSGLGRWHEQRKILLKESKTWPWSTKLDKGFFRGSRTNSDRDVIVLLSRSKPDLVDAAYTKNQAWKSDADTLNAPPADEVSLQDHCKYKYLFNFAGVAASFRFKHLFLCGSLVVHVGDSWSEFFYSSLKPWVHYVPLPLNSSKNLVERLLIFLRRNDQIAERIARRGQQWIKKHLKLKHVTCYWDSLLRRYHDLLLEPVSFDPNLQLIT